MTDLSPNSAEVDETEEGNPVESPQERRIVTQPYDFSVRTLIDQVADGSLTLQDVYQRNFIWEPRRSSRLIESLLLNIPIPVCYFAEEEESKLTVVDGHQRLKSISDFCDDHLKLSELEVLPEFSGKRFSELERRVQRSLLSRTIRCIVIMRETSPQVRFEVFERLNTGAVILNAQEVRNCIYHGRLNELLKQLASDPDFLYVQGRDERNDRMLDCELALRFFALRSELEHYRPPMKRYLTDYMRENRNPSDSDLRNLQNSFKETIQKVRVVFGNRGFRRWRGEDWEANTNRAVFDSVMLVFAMAPYELVDRRRASLLEGFKTLCTSNDKFIDATSRATGDKARLLARLRLVAEVAESAGLPRLDVPPT